MNFLFALQSHPPGGLSLRRCAGSLHACVQRLVVMMIMTSLCLLLILVVSWLCIGSMLWGKVPQLTTSPHEQELSHCFERVLDVLAAEQPDKDAVVDAILTYAYYWYNFMPLARGTAVVGYIVILALFLAAGMPITAAIPKVDFYAHNVAIKRMHTHFL